MHTKATGPVLVVMLLPGIVLAEPQSLADVAREEAARRKTITAPGRLYTNRDLPALPSSLSPQPIGAGEPGARAAGSGQADPQGQPAEAPDAGTRERDWRARADALRQALARSEIVAAALQSRINALTTDEANRDDPAQRTVLAAERDKAVGELERVRREIADDHAAVEALQEEARRAGVPPGWLRERPR